MEVISKEMIKPLSSSAHNHLTNLKPSLFDQLAPPIYVPLILFYQPEHRIFDPNEISQRLKQSLSNTLTQFFPLAGKLDLQSFIVNCNDDGVQFVETRARGRVSDVVEEHNMENLKQYLPMDPTYHAFTDVLLAVQINFFDCGGFAVGICLSHRVADGASIMEFINAWASSCKTGGKSEVTATTTNFGVLPSHFPIMDLSTSAIPTSILIPKEKVVTKRFVFDEEKLTQLKQVASNFVVNDPTRVELVTAFIWKTIIGIAKSKGSNKSICSASHAVNLRSMSGSNPELQHAFGNYFMDTIAITGDDQSSLHEFVSLLRNAIRKIDNEYVRDTRNTYLTDIIKFYDVLSKGDIISCGFSSWCRFPVYEVDFGWGKPVWVTTTTLPLINFVMLLDTKSGYGVEALVNLAEDDIHRFETHFKLIWSST